MSEHNKEYIEDIKIRRESGDNDHTRTSISLILYIVQFKVNHAVLQYHMCRQ